MMAITSTCPSPPPYSLVVGARVTTFIRVLHRRANDRGGRAVELNRNGRYGLAYLTISKHQLATPMPWLSYVADRRCTQKETTTGRAEESEKLGLLALHMGNLGLP